MVTELKRIVLAEDNANDVELTLAALAEINLANEVVVVRDGAEALDYLMRRNEFADRSPGNPAVLLLDLKMPKVTGFEVLQWIKKTPKLRNLPVVVWSNSALDEDKQRAMDLGATDYVVKTADRNTLDSLLRDLHSRFLAVSKA